MFTDSGVVRRPFRVLALLATLAAFVTAALATCGQQH